MRAIPRRGRVTTDGGHHHGSAYADPGRIVGWGDASLEFEARDARRGRTLSIETNRCLSRRLCVGFVLRGSLRQLIDLGCHDEIALRQAVNFVGPESDFGAAPGEQDVRMVSLLFGDFTHSVDKL